MYVWLERKKSGKVHELDENGTSYCLVENNGLKTIMRLSKASEIYPSNRQLCWCCRDVKKQRLHDATHGHLDQEFREIMR